LLPRRESGTPGRIVNRIQFELQKKCPNTRARATRFRTLHGEVQTPVFMPVGTRASVKAQPTEWIADLEFPVILANTYHLLLRPGPEVFKKFGGIHRFMQWERSVLTDSGGFQIFCLENSRVMSDHGARFRSYIDGAEILLTPELSIQMQRAIGSDIMMVLDQCVPSTCDRALAETAMHRTHAWAKRSLDAREDSPQALFGIVQGACFEDLRKESADFLKALPFDGLAIGGLAVGESKEEREHFCGLVADLLPEDRPRYLMGVGTPIDLLEAVARGVDLFDCILPNSLAQQGVAFSWNGKTELNRTLYALDSRPIDEDCTCWACRKYSRGYLHHLIRSKEILGWTLVANHNLRFYRELSERMRQAILEDRFGEFYAKYRPILMRSGAQVAEIARS
jgi:queuine tRNA-ribosyltransferase